MKNKKISLLLIGAVCALSCVTAVTACAPAYTRSYREEGAASTSVKDEYIYAENDEALVESGKEDTFAPEKAYQVTEAALTTSSTAGTDAWRSTKGYNYHYYTQLGSDVMPIGAWCAPTPALTLTVNGKTVNYPNQITLANYQTLAESGINSVYGLYAGVQSNGANLSNVLNALDYANQAGVVYMVRDGAALSQLSSNNPSTAWSRMQQYMSKPAYGGTLMMDEPGYSKFSEIGEMMEEWRSNETYGEEKLAYINNLPNYATAAQLYYGVTSTATSVPVNYANNYEAWVREYIQTVNPQIFSYDFYPYNGTTTSVLSGYYDNMSAVRKVCMEYNIPFWTFQQVGAFDGGMRDFSYAEIAIQAHSSLAYGAKGIQWFNYWQPLEFPTQPASAMVDHYGNKTVYYDYVQKVNRQIAAVDHVLMKSKSAGVIQIGKSDLGTIPSRDILNCYGALTTATGTGNAIIGCFEYRDYGYAYYVSSSSTTSSAAVKLNFDGLYNVEKIQDAKSTTTTCNSITVSVPAGEGVLIVVPKQKASTTSYSVSAVNGNAAAGAVVGGGKYGVGATATLVAVPNAGYVFDGWYDGSTKVSTSLVYSCVVRANKSYTAKWVGDASEVVLNACDAIGSEKFASYTAINSLSKNYVKQGSSSVKVVGPSTSNLIVPYLKVGNRAATRSDLAGYKYLKMDVYASYTVTSSTAYGLNLFMIDRLAGTLQQGWNEIVIPMEEVLAAVDGFANFAPSQLDVQGGFYLITYAPGTMYFDNIRMDNVGPVEEEDVVEPTGDVALNSGDEGLVGATGLSSTLTTQNAVAGNGIKITSKSNWAHGYLPLRENGALLTLAQLQAKYEEITFTLYVATAGVRISTASYEFFNLSTGVNEITIPTSRLSEKSGSGVANYLDGKGLFLQIYYSGYTVHIDNVVGVREKDGGTATPAPTKSVLNDCTIDYTANAWNASSKLSTSSDVVGAGYVKVTFAQGLSVVYIPFMENGNFLTAAQLCAKYSSFTFKVYVPSGATLTIPSKVIAGNSTGAGAWYEVTISAEELTQASAFGVLNYNDNAGLYLSCGTAGASIYVGEVTGTRR